MKKTILALLITTFSVGLIAQNVNDDIEILRDMAAAERKALVAENLQLNEEESKIFWPLYDDFRAEMKKIGTARIENIQKFAENFDKMTDEVALEIMKNYSDYQVNYNKVRKTYMDKMLKNNLSPKLVFRFFQIENKVDALINYGVTAEIPLIIKE